MQTYFYNLSGGINMSASKTALGLDTKRLYWSDSKNVEILKNGGIVRQNGNVLLLKLQNEEKIIGLHSIKDGTSFNFLIATGNGNLYIYNSKNSVITKLPKTVEGSSKVCFVNFLDGVVIGSKSDPLFYINNDVGYETQDCNIRDKDGNLIKSDVICVYAGRVWVADGSTLYYSALGKYADFSTENDAGYINNFYTDINTISALKTYKDYLAIYKENAVYLLSGTNAGDFKIVPFADKGTQSCLGVVNVNNKQYFINQSVFSMEQAGLLSQIQMGGEISLKIKPEFDCFDKSRMGEVIVLHYELKNQVWYFIPYINDEYFHNIWIYDYINDSWFKRVVPQNIKTACLSQGLIITADNCGNVYKEDFGSTFDGVAIEFMWKSPFLAAGDSNVRKTVEEFFFILDENYDNNFNFSVYKDYDDKYRDDEDSVYSSSSENLIWHGDGVLPEINCYWNCDDIQQGDNQVYSVWATGSNSVYKAEISESNYSVQLCIEGRLQEQNAAIIGLEFKEIYLDE